MGAGAIIEAATSRPTSLQTKAGRVLSGLSILLLGIDAAAKLLVPAVTAAYTPPQLRIPADPSFYRLLGSMLAVATILYALPRTAVLGAILLTGYLGGAVATHLLAASPLVSNTLFGAYLGVAIWAGLWLRNARVRALLPASS